MDGQQKERTESGVLPKNWDHASLGEVCQKPQYGYTTKAAPAGSIKLLRTTDITSGKIDWDSVPYCNTQPEDTEKYLLRHNDIVVSRAGSVGVSYLIREPERSVFASYLIRFLPRIDPEYVRYFLESPRYWEAISEHQLGIAVPNVNATKLSKIQIPVAPENEQRRIVAKIEEHFSGLDKSVESLRTARAQLKTYRQSLLKAAFEGRLTEQWRRDNADKLETADQLLQRIRDERETHHHEKLKDWQTALDKWQTNGKRGKKPVKPKSRTSTMPALRQPEAPELESVGKDWAELGELADVVGGITKNQKRQTLSNKKPFLRVANVYANELRLDNMHSIGVSESELAKVTLEPGDLLVVEGNGSVDQLGRVAVWDGSVPECIHQNHLIRVRPSQSMIGKYIMWFLLSTYGRTCIKKVASSTSGLHTLSISKVQKLPIPLCGTCEQAEIVAQIEAALTRVEHLEITIDNSVAQAESLRQSILKRAFEGKLVPQDPNDEPASALLERIRVEQEKVPKSRRRRQKAEA